jgi:lysophospholipase L1-like esterase
MLQFNQPLVQPGQKLVCLGDSITAAAQGYVSILQKRLGPKGIEVINAGVGGDKTPQALARLQSDVLDRKPDAVSVFLGANDACIGRAIWADEPAISPETFRGNLVWIIHLCRRAGISRFSLTPPLWRPEGPAYELFGNVFAPYCQATRDAAGELQIPVVPADAAFADHWARHPGHTGLLLTADGIHPTAEGHGLIADAMLRSWVLA